MHAGQGADEFDADAVGRFDRDDLRPAREEPTRRLARAASETEDPTCLGGHVPADRLRPIRRAASLVGGCGRSEGLGLCSGSSPLVHMASTEPVGELSGSRRRVRRFGGESERRGTGEKVQDDLSPSVTAGRDQYRRGKTMTANQSTLPIGPNDVRITDFDQFYEKTAKRMVAVVSAVTGDLGEAEDAVQEAYARAWQRWAKLIEEGDPTPWVRTVALRLAVSTWRKKRNRMWAHFRHGPPPDAPELAPDRVALVDALRSLGSDQRTAVVIHHLLDLSVDEIARETGVTAATVKTRLSRGRKALGARLQDEPESPGSTHSNFTRPTRGRTEKVSFRG
ncbi:SigE family RNA polymerase sigma factor [Actinacidiphila sp. ITFR-21]|uniref:SigE family RNA polymerase sigma factor n=1 Tax=Actinacidiphila sp. ITFR-21 TaxID=3075199 RepID=UPI00288A3376|nr:SigE family RNA polymerase sigma factor [Streptomyces sp. ITFR-21]WNI18168.1 SigE family RNA polymerase sigma factor [Streptomyces sp. ITFR-21]